MIDCFTFPGFRDGNCQDLEDPNRRVHQLSQCVLEMFGVHIGRNALAYPRCADLPIELVETARRGLEIGVDFSQLGRDVPENEH